MTDGKSRTLFSGTPFRRGRWRRAASLTALGALALGLAACQARIDTRGNLPDPELVEKLQPGVQDRDQVAQLLGSPSSVGTFDDSKWYYISKRTETLAFFDPEIVDQQVLVVEFDDAGMLSDVKLYDEDDRQDVELVERETPTSGTEMTVLKQFFGNIGRFNRVEDDQ